MSVLTTRFWIVISNCVSTGCKAADLQKFLTILWAVAVFAFAGWKTRGLVEVVLMIDGNPAAVGVQKGYGTIGHVHLAFSLSPKQHEYGYLQESARTHKLGDLPAPSGAGQADIYAPLKLRCVLVGDARLGGISATLCALLGPNKVCLQEGWRGFKRDTTSTLTCCDL